MLSFVNADGVLNGAVETESLENLLLSFYAYQVNARTNQVG